MMSLPITMTEIRYCNCCGEVQVLCPICNEWHSVDRVKKRGDVYEVYGRDMYARMSLKAWEHVEMAAKRKCKSLKKFPVVVIP
jgi:hypothetical protein